MNVTKMVVKNLTRRRGRFVFTLMGIAIGIAAVVAFLALGGSLKREIRRESAALGANLVVTPKGSCAYEQVSILTGEQLPTTITRREVERIAAIGGITALPFVTGRTALENRPVSVLGILPEETFAFRGWELAEGRYFPQGAAPGAVVGAVVASRFGIGPGGRLTIRGNEIAVQGVLAETGAKDDVTIFLPLAEAQRIYNDAYGRDRQFFDFWVSMDAMRTGLQGESTRFVGPPDNDFFRFFGDITGGAEKGAEAARSFQ